MSAHKILLFSYRTPQNQNVQIASFCRELEGRPDALPGYVRRMVAMAALDVVALSSEAYHPNAEVSSDPEDAVAGTIFEITEQNWPQTDMKQPAATAGFQ